jgi:hypothetical protein
MTSRVSSQGTITTICSAYVEYRRNFLNAQLTRETVFSISPHFYSVFVRYLDMKATGFLLPSCTWVMTTNPTFPFNEEYT